MSFEKSCFATHVRLQHRCFPVNTAKFLRTVFFTKHLWWLLLVLSKICGGDSSYMSLYKKWSFPLRISSVNVTKSAGNCGWPHLLKKTLIVNFIFCAVFDRVLNLPLWCLRNLTFIGFNPFFPMRPFSTSWKHQKTLRFSDVSMGVIEKVKKG